MAKTRTTFLCRDCGGVHPKWMGRCPDCGGWDTLEAFREPEASASVGTVAGIALRGEAAGEESAGVAELMLAQATPLPEVEGLEIPRRSTGVMEFDRVLGGGIVPGASVLLGGEPGIGKSTLLLQTAVGMVRAGGRVLYASSEESPQQIKLRADRLLGEDAPSLDELFLCTETSLIRILEQIRRVEPTFIVLDSIQMVHRTDLDAPAGSTTQIRRCCHDLVQAAKLTQAGLVVVGHVTKEGQLAGPKLLEHVVDVVLAFEGDRDRGHRVLRAAKNRFGSTQEIGLFEMTERGLQEAEHAADAVDASGGGTPGLALSATLAGTRCLPIEVQALTATGFLGSAKRRASGLDGNRLAMLIAVLEKHGEQRLADQDIFASVVGGARVVEPAVDLAILLAIAGAHLNRGLEPGTVVLGEVGLAGEVRPIRHLEQRLREMGRRGATKALIPGVQASQASELEVVCTPVHRVSDALGALG